MRESKKAVKFIEKMYKLYEQKMYKIAYSILRDSGLAEDAVQEAFLKLMKRDVYFEDPASDDCKRYLITVIKHSSIDIYNKKRREQEVMCASYDDVEETVGQEDRSGGLDLEEIISSLPPKYYAVVNCLIIKDLTVNETAVELGITAAAVRKRFQRAKLLLKIQKGCEGHETGSSLYKSSVS